MHLAGRHLSCVCSRLGAESREGPHVGLSRPPVRCPLPACDARAPSPSGTSVPRLTARPRLEVCPSGSAGTGTPGAGAGAGPAWTLS